MIKLVTHNQGFHADDVMAYAILQEVLTKRGETWTIERTRDQAIIDAADIAFDIGYEYDPARNRYDHHQPGKAGARPNGVQYAACGLIWKHFGRELCSEAVWELLDKSMFQEMDASDSGQTFIKEFVFPDSWATTLTIHIARFEAHSYQEKTPEQFLVEFESAAAFARGILQRAIANEEFFEQAFQQASEEYRNAPDKQIIQFSRNFQRPTWKRIAEYPEPIFAVYFNYKNNDWKVEAVPVTPFVLESRKTAPAAWYGLRDQELQHVTGVSDATFCHPSGFLFGARSFEGAMQLAKLALIA